jgi:hypothetical protein
MPKLDIATRNIVIGRHQVSELQNTFARFYNVHRSTISRLLQRYQQSGSTADRQRSGRPRTNDDNYRKIAIDRNGNFLLCDTIQTPYNDHIQMVQWIVLY